MLPLTTAATATSGAHGDCVRCSGRLKHGACHQAVERLPSADTRQTEPGCGHGFIYSMSIQTYPASLQHRGPAQPIKKTVTVAS